MHVRYLVYWLGIELLIWFSVTIWTLWKWREYGEHALTLTLSSEVTFFERIPRFIGACQHGLQHCICSLDGTSLLPCYYQLVMYVG